MTPTPYQVIFHKFKLDIKKDADFFYYANVLEEETEELIYDRCKRYLDKSIEIINMNIVYRQINFNNKNDELKTFNFQLNNMEIELIVDLMLEMMLSEDVASMKFKETYFSDMDLKVFSPAKNRDSFMKMYNDTIYTNEKKMKKYGSISRKTGRYLTREEMQQIQGIKIEDL